MSKINMGNDEFILYIRKQYPACKIKSDKLGSMIWIWIRENDPDAIQHSQTACLWGKQANNVDAVDLPYTATQFEFDRSLLIRLYDYLDELGNLKASSDSLVDGTSV